jgi:hypothetical protein
MMKWKHILATEKKKKGSRPLLGLCDNPTKATSFFPSRCLMELSVSSIH